MFIDIASFNIKFVACTIKSLWLEALPDNELNIRCNISGKSDLLLVQTVVTELYHIIFCIAGQRI